MMQINKDPHRVQLKFLAQIILREFSIAPLITRNKCVVVENCRSNILKSLIVKPSIIMVYSMNK